MKVDRSERVFFGVMWAWVLALVVFVAFMWVTALAPTKAHGAPPFESRSYPTLSPTPATSWVERADSVYFINPPAPGYQRRLYAWSARTIDKWTYNKYAKPQWQRTVLCVVPGGQSVQDVPTPGQPVVEMLVFLGGSVCESNRHEIYAVHRTELDWRTYIGARMYQPGETRTLTLYPAVGETVIVRKTQ